MTAHRFLILALVFGAAAAETTNTSNTTNTTTSTPTSATTSTPTSEITNTSNTTSTTTSATTPAAASTTTPTANSTTTSTVVTTPPPTPQTVVTTPPPTPETVTGNLELSGFANRAAADAFIANNAAKTALKNAIAHHAGSSVNPSDVAVVLTVVARRLQEIDGVKPRALQGTVRVNVAYTITLAAGTASSAVNTVATTLTGISDADFTSKITSQLAAAGVTGYTLTVSNTGAVNPSATTVAPTTTPAPVVESGAAKTGVTSILFVLTSAWMFSA